MESNKKFYDGEKSAGALQLEGGFLVIFSLACAKQGKREREEKSQQAKKGIGSKGLR